MRTSGTIMPSSRFLIKKMLRNVDFSNADVIVELGPGNGVFTHAILNKLHPKTTLVCFEINPEFFNHLSKIKHQQLIVLNASAEDIITELNKLGYEKANHIISSLPLTFIPKEIATEILKNCYLVLQNNGLFMQFQYSLSYYKQLKKVFKSSISLSFEALNIPPAFIYKCKKNVNNRNI